ncbi:MAG: triose-phosphate isomerase [Bacteroidales bacterium]|nr:triose-phosphate isomerase [Bacteroidales bacterium]
MRKNIVAGNWKMNTSVVEGEALIQGILERMQEVPSSVQLVVAPPFTHLVPAAAALRGSSVALSAQNCADQLKGAYTGEVAAPMIAGIGCQYVILGHSERREYYGETSQTLVRKIDLALAEGLKPIYCVGEKLEEREANRHFEVVEAQIREVLFHLTPEQFAQVVIAYEPVWAIGTGKTATAEQAQEIHAFIRKTIADQFGQTAADEVSILYGGSCKPSNAKELFACPDIDGGLIGGAALKAEDFIGIAVSF